jgi:hypothetical protein
MRDEAFSSGRMRQQAAWIVNAMSNQTIVFRERRAKIFCWGQTGGSNIDAIE